MGRRLENGRPEGQKPAQQFGSRQPWPEGQAQSKNNVDCRPRKIRMIAERLTQQALHHHRATAFEKVLLAADLEVPQVNESRAFLEQLGHCLE